QTNDIVYSVAFSPDGKILALGCGLTVRPGGEATVRLWDIDEQQEVAILHGHKDDVYSVAFSRNGRWLASGSQDGTVLLWRVNLPSPYQPVGAKGKQPIILGGLKRTMLLQNFPNPFNPETWIPYHLTEETPVTIRIYDARGRLVRRLELGQKTAGAYLTKETAAYWDGRNELGESMASGLYFYRLNAGEFTATRRMFVVK
ncbi:MAG: FlgD immunoglobulin-like domain containing protein, partial [Candidatus Poribacteria bacterium]